MTNREWIDLLSKEFSVSRTSARDMLHAVMNIKRYDNFKRLFNPLPESSKECAETHVTDLIRRRAALDAICDNCDTVKASCPHYPCGRYVAVEKLPPQI